MKTYPWELTKKEWNAERDRIRPCTAATRFTGRSASDRMGQIIPWRALADDQECPSDTRAVA